MDTTNATITPTKKYDEKRFEFLLYINNHIICQRGFDIYNFNNKVRESEEMKTLLNTIAGTNNDDFGSMGIIPKFMKDKSIDYLWNNFNPYAMKIEEGNKNIFERVDDFQFEIRVDKTTVGKIQFSGNNFQPKIRYAMDIRELIPSIIAEIRNSFSEDNYVIFETY